MKLSEFKAWFEGFTEGMSGPPDAAQWARITARIAEIDGVAVTERILIDRYRSIGPWHEAPYYYRYSAGTSAAEIGHSVLSRPFSGHVAMADLGRAEHAALSGCALSARAA